MITFIMNHYHHPHHAFLTGAVGGSGIRVPLVVSVIFLPPMIPSRRLAVVRTAASDFNPDAAASAAVTPAVAISPTVAITPGSRWQGFDAVSSRRGFSMKRRRGMRRLGGVNVNDIDAG